jgi:hypothetical protein
VRRCCQIGNFSLAAIIFSDRRRCQTRVDTTKTMRSSGEDGELFYGKRCQALFVHFRHAFLELFSRDLRARRFGLLLLMCAFSPAFLIGIFGLWPSNGKLLNESAAGA